MARSTTAIMPARAGDVVDHPLAAEQLARLRDERHRPRRVPPGHGRPGRDAGLRGVPPLLESVDEVVQTPARPGRPPRVAEWPVVVPILRAGLGMMSAVHGSSPRPTPPSSASLATRPPSPPSPTCSRCPPSLAGRAVLVLDPMLATGGSLLHTCRLLAGTGRRSDHRRVRAGRARGGRAASSPRGSASTSSPPRSTTPRRPGLHRPRPRRRRRPPLRHRMSQLRCSCGAQTQRRLHPGRRSQALTRCRPPSGALPSARRRRPWPWRRSSSPWMRPPRRRP